MADPPFSPKTVVVFSSCAHDLPRLFHSTQRLPLIILSLFHLPGLRLLSIHFFPLLGPWRTAPDFRRSNRSYDVRHYISCNQAKPPMSKERRRNGLINSLALSLVARPLRQPIIDVDLPPLAVIGMRGRKHMLSADHTERRGVALERRRPDGPFLLSLKNSGTVSCVREPEG